jgi:hypothetical protein
MTSVDYDICRECGIDHEKLLRIAKRISKAVLELEEMGLHLFGHSGSGVIVMESPSQLHQKSDRGDTTMLLLGTVEGSIDGGDPNYLNG